MTASALVDFLTTVVTTKQGFFELGVRNGEYKQHWYEWPQDLNTIVSHSLQAQGDVYFSSHLFSSRDSHKENVLPSRTIQQDLDNADVGILPIAPSILTSTSPSRHQGFWILDTEFDSLQQAEGLSKKLAYSIPLCDRSGWPLGHKVRVPFTRNYKYNTGPQPVTIVKSTSKLYTIDELEILPDIPSLNNSNSTIDLSFIERTPTPLSIGAYQLIEQIKDHLTAKVYAEYSQDSPASDRSVALYTLMCQAFRAGLSRDEVYWIAYHSPNNKFHADLRFNADRELAKDVLRAEQATKSLQINIRDAINNIRRKTKVLINERRQQIYDLILTAMQADGEFAHLVDGRRYYIPKDIGRPIEIEGMSESLSSLLDIKYSLNRTEIEHNYVRGALISYVGTLPEANTAAVLSHYDPKSKHVLIHGGRKDIYVIEADKVTQTQQPAYNSVFPWDRIIEPFTPSLGESNYMDWGATLFEVPNVINMTPEEARTVLKVWLLFSLLRDMASSRPILAFFGQPGCLAEDTIVSVRHGKNESKYTLADLYSKVHRSYDKKHKHGDRGFSSSNNSPVEVLSLKDGLITYQPIEDIISSGVKQTYYVGTTDGRSVHATEDHLFLTPNGYKSLKELKTGDTVLVRGTITYKDRQPKVARKRVSAKYHPYGSSEVVGGKVYPRIVYTRAVVEAHLNNMSIKDFLYIIHNDKERSALLTYLEKDANVHHIDRNKNNNALENLEVLSREDHSREHVDVTRLGNFRPQEVTIDYIFKWKMEPTYDITMKDQDAPNFLADDFIVHNSGKTTTARKLYGFFYGKHMDVSGATSPVNYDIATASLPFYVLDNLDTWEKWLPDRLAQSAGKTDVVVRKLYTNNQIIRIKRQAMVAVTAHDPKFGRADVTDRMLIISLQRFSNLHMPFKDEGSIFDSVIDNRNKLWGSVIQDLQRVLATNLEPDTDLQLRIQDFARYGEWIAEGIGERDTFRSAVGSLQAAQRAFNLDEDHILVSAITRWLVKHKTAPPQPKNQDDLYKEVMSLVPQEDIKTFQLLYKNSSSFSKRISNLQDTLNNTVFKVNITLGKGGQRLWHITPKEQE